jgi:hypothetical protein
VLGAATVEFTLDPNPNRDRGVGGFADFLLAAIPSVTIGLLFFGWLIALLIRPFAGPAPFALRRSVAAAARAAWVVVPGVAAMAVLTAWILYRYRYDWSNTPVIASEVFAVPREWIEKLPLITAAVWLALSLRALDRDDLPGGSADSADPPETACCEGCGYPTRGLDLAGRCPECGLSLSDNSRRSESARSGWWREWLTIRRTMRREGADYFRRLPMWSGHSASRRVLLASAVVGAVGATAAMFLLESAVGLSRLAADVRTSVIAGIAASVIPMFPISLGTVIVGTSASAWLVRLSEAVFSHHPCRIARVGRVVAFHSAVAVVPFAAGALIWSALVPAAMMAPEWAFRTDLFDLSALLKLLGAVLSLMGLHALALTVWIHVRIARAMARVRFAAS